MLDKRKILIIDDEADLCLLLNNYFLRRNHSVIISNNLTEGLSSLKTFLPDVVFLDNNLPDGTGWSYAEQIANELPNIHIVFISAFDQPIPEMPENSSYSYIEKPISFADLNSLISSSKLQSV